MDYMGGFQQLCYSLTHQTCSYTGSRLHIIGRAVCTQHVILASCDRMSKVVSSHGEGVELCVSWVPHRPHQPLPPNAVKAGPHVYVIRARHDGEYVPGKMVEGHQDAYISHGGKEIPKSEFEILVNTDVNSTEHAGCDRGFCWLHARDGQVPRYALMAGTDQGRPLFIARTSHDGEVCVGKVLREHACGYVPHGGQEHKVHEYEVLCMCEKNF